MDRTPGTTRAVRPDGGPAPVSTAANREVPRGRRGGSHAARALALHPSPLATPRSAVQVGRSDDPLEREADRAAERAVGGLTGTGLCIRRTCAACQDELSRQDDGIIRRDPGGEGGGARGGVAPGAAAPPPPASTPVPAGGRPLTPAARTVMEAGFGRDFGDVRIHTGPEADRASRSIGARAYTLGRDVVFRQGAYDPSSREGTRLLAHELAHVAQQTGGAPAARVGADRTRPVVRRQDTGEEHQADSVNFQVMELSPEAFEARTGVRADALPEGEFVREGDVWGQGGVGLAATPWVSPVPVGGVGIQWTTAQAGHLSVFSQTPGGSVVRGFRGTLWSHLTGGERLYEGVPGAWRNDVIMRLSPEVYYVWRQASIPDSVVFGERLEGIRYDTDYYFPSDARRTPIELCRGGSNCITVPREPIIEALGGPPELVVETPGGPAVTVDVTQQGRAQAGGPFYEEQAGRGRTMMEYLDQPEAYFAERGLTRTRWGPAQLAGQGGILFLRVGGKVLMIYGVYHSTERILEAPPDQVDRVVMQEGGAWAVGLPAGMAGSAIGAAITGALGAAVTGAESGAVFCAPSGLGAFVCAAGGAAGGLILGAVGGYFGYELGDFLYELPGMAGNAVIETLEESDDPVVRADGQALRRAASGDVWSEMYLIERFIGAFSGY